MMSVKIGDYFLFSNFIRMGKINFYFSPPPLPPHEIKFSIPNKIPRENYRLNPGAYPRENSCFIPGVYHVENLE